MAQISQLLRRMRAGDAAARDALFPAAYEQLRRLARARLREGGRSAVLDTTSLVHECYLRFVGTVSCRRKTGEAALYDCDESLRLKPDGAAALDSRAVVYFRMRRFDAAIADLDKALSRYRNANSLYVRGPVKRRRQDTAGGDADIAAAKTIDPKIAERYEGYGVKR